MNIPAHFLDRIREAQEKQLEELDLSNDYSTKDKDKLFKIPDEVFTLKHLKKLKLSHNQIYEIPESIGKLSNLTQLDLRKNQLTTVPESISKLSNLTQLGLRKNQLTTVPESISKLSNLTWLDLSANQLTTVPESISKLSNLTWLDLSANQLTTVPESISKLSNLTWLNLSANQLTTVPESISKLSNLNWLNLSGNQLTTVPESIGKLSNLNWLNLSGNQLTTVPESIGKLSNLNWLYLSDNPLESPPIEIAEQGIEAIREYFRQLQEAGTDYIYEAKLLILGEAGAGKTTLAKKIDNRDYQLLEDEDSTRGIDIIQWDFNLDNQKQFRVNIWDFGGQEIYHATHQFFLTKRSLYILLADSRKEDTDFYYWLNVVGLLSENSPLLIIKNEKQDRQQDINETALRGQFSNLKETLATNLASNRGLDSIITNIKHYIKTLPHIGQALPKTWVKVRQTLEDDRRNHISLDEYLQICEQNGFKLRQDKLQLSGYLHDLGVCLHFQDEEYSILYKTVILKPEWGTDAVYKVLDNPKVVKKLGCFTRKDLDIIWQEEKYVSIRGELLELMKKFQLCYEIPGNKDKFIAPQLLSENQPEYDWDNSNNLILRYKYPDFMPKGIITRFIVVMHQYIDQQKYVWKSGVILNKDNTQKDNTKKDNTKAEVIEYYGKRQIQIRIAGASKRNLMTIVIHELDKINDSYKTLNYQKLIPCNCKVCELSQNPYEYEFNKLQERIDNNKLKIECGNPPYQEIEVLSLIENTIDINQLISKEKQDSNKSISFEGNTIQQIIMQGENKGDISSTNTNYNSKDNCYEQRGNNNTMANTYQNHYGSGDNVGKNTNITNIYNSQDLTQAAADIQALLEQLEKSYPTNTTKDKKAIATEAIDRIDHDPKLTEKILSALKTGGISALESLLNHPAASFVINALEDWQQNKISNQ
jgi:internalin A